MTALVWWGRAGQGLHNAAAEPAFRAPSGLSSSHLQLACPPLHTHTHTHVRMPVPRE